jgi:prefoldin beta subunit
MDQQNLIEELQALESGIQSLIMQKQNLQIELNESLNALSEVEKTNDDVYKILNGIMIKADKTKVLADLKEKKKLFELRVNSIEKQEKIFEEKAEKMRKELNEAMNKKK